jgi:membrane protein YqaA with SNARE-associated domain
MEFRKYWSSPWWAEKINPTAQRIAARPRAEALLFIFEVSALLIFPIPVALVLVAFTTAAPQKWWRFALSASAGSLLASYLLFLLGQAFFQSFGERVISFYNLQSNWGQILDRFDGGGGISLVLFAGLTTGVTRIVCLAAGFSGMHPVLFAGLIVVSRSTRFLAECAAIKYLGEKARKFPRRVYHYVPIAFPLVFLLALLIFVLL